MFYNLSWAKQEWELTRVDSWLFSSTMAKTRMRARQGWLQTTANSHRLSWNIWACSKSARVHESLGLTKSESLNSHQLSSLCNIEHQTLHHLLINCTITVEFWTLFQEWWHQKTDETITLSTTHILYGWHDRTKHWRVLNYCLLTAKYCIFCASLRGDVPDFQSFLLSVDGKLEILKEIATAKKALPKYYRTWAALL